MKRKDSVGGSAATLATQVMSRKTYDVWADPQTENTRLVRVFGWESSSTRSELGTFQPASSEAADINSMPDGRVILVACKALTAKLCALQKQFSSMHARGGYAPRTCGL